jgi:hypothetical protein
MVISFQTVCALWNAVLNGSLNSQLTPNLLPIIEDEGVIHEILCTTLSRVGELRGGENTRRSCQPTTRVMGWNSVLNSARIELIPFGGTTVIRWEAPQEPSGFRWKSVKILA